MEDGQCWLKQLSCASLIFPQQVPVSSSLWSSLLLLAMGQGLFLAAALFNTRLARQRSANVLLALLLLIFVLIIGDAWMSLNGFERRYPHLIHASISLPLLVGPLLYLYLAAILGARTGAPRTWLHFLPFMLGLLAWAPYYLQDGASKLQILAGTRAIPAMVSWFAVPKAISLMAYLSACVRLTRQARRACPEQALARVLARLTLGLAIGLVAVLVLFWVEHLVPDLPLSSDTLGGLVLMVFVYALAVVAIRLPPDYRPQPLPRLQPKYAATQLSAEQRAAYLARLQESMVKEQLFRDGELKLETLASHLALTVHELSQVVNDCCGVNFQDYLNQLRVEAFKSALHDPDNAGRSILDLAVDCGFNSKSAFNRAFKKHVGMTPSDFRRRAAAAAAPCPVPGAKS